MVISQRILSISICCQGDTQGDRNLSKDFIEKSTALSDEEKKKILGENAKGFYGFPELEVPEKIINMVE